MHSALLVPLLRAAESGGEAAGHGDGGILKVAWLIPLIPAVSYLVILLFGKKMPKKGCEPGIIALGASWVLAVACAAEWIKNEHVVNKSTSWFTNGKVDIRIGMHVDG